MLQKTVKYIISAYLVVFFTGYAWAVNTKIHKLQRSGRGRAFRPTTLGCGSNNGVIDHNVDVEEGYRVFMSTPSGYSVLVVGTDNMPVHSDLIVDTNIPVRAVGLAALNKWQPIIAKASATGIDANTLRALILVESGGNHLAVSRKGAVGLCQLMPRTATKLGANPWDPEHNVLAAAKYLRQLLDRYNRLDVALAAYNAGPAAVDKYGGIPPYDETRKYVRSVLAYRERFSVEAQQPN